MYLKGIAIGGYRSFGPNIQRMAPLSKINILAGENNCGKSNVLYFLNDLFRSFLTTQIQKAISAQDDYHLNSTTRRITLGLVVPASRTFWMEKLEVKKNAVVLDQLEELFKLPLFNRETEFAWLERRFVPGGENGLLQDTEVSSIPPAEHGAFCYVFDGMFPQGRSNDNAYKIRSVLQKIRTCVWNEEGYPLVEYIPAFRHILGGSSKLDRGTDALMGQKLVTELARYSNPERHENHLKNEFEKIVEFIRNVTGDPTATLRVPHSKDRILVNMRDRGELPLELLGTGIHQVIILAAICTLRQDRIVCLEEPEIYLHPVLQRKLLNYLSTQTENQYFVSTHSAHVLDTEGANVFHLEMINGETVCSQAVTSTDKWKIAKALGFKASDIFQSNCVIWVEGPSDILYLRHWIKSIDSSLFEGIHFSLMFYGGKLLSHLDVDTEHLDTESFISLACINRHPAIVFDLDRSSANLLPNPTKQRIVSALTKYGGHAWITDGREIENYIPRELLKQAVESVAPGYGDLVAISDYERALPKKKNSDGNETDASVDKVEVARFVTERPADLSHLGLRDRVHQLVNFIRCSNHLSELPTSVVAASPATS